MIADYVYSPDLGLIVDVLKQFDITIPTLNDHIAITRFEVITPDSFMWRIALVNDAVYYLYAEDYVPGIDYIASVYDHYIVKHTWQMIPAKLPTDFNDTSAVTSAVVYQEPDESQKLMKYAAHSGYDYVFLARSDEDPRDALFSDSAPNGFSMTG